MRAHDHNKTAARRVVHRAPPSLSTSPISSSKWNPARRDGFVAADLVYRMLEKKRGGGGIFSLSLFFILFHFVSLLLKVNV